VCADIGRLWEEKSSLEVRLWDIGDGGGRRSGEERRRRKTTNPFDDDYDDENDDDDGDAPIVGRFWHDRPGSDARRLATRYCAVLLRLVQYLGRGESWRAAAASSSSSSRGDRRRAGGRSRRRGATGSNPPARELAIDAAFVLLALDRTDMRVRAMVPPLLLEGGYVREAYGYLRWWLRPETTLAIVDLALAMGGAGGTAMMAGDGTTTTKIRPEDVLEPPEDWMDGEMVYPSVGMVFELAYLKCRLLCSVRSRGRPPPPEEEAAILPEDGEDGDDDEIAEIAEIVKRCDAADGVERELERQVALLLSVVHRWNPHLLPNLAGPRGGGAPPPAALPPPPPMPSSDGADDDDVDGGAAIPAGGDGRGRAATTEAPAGLSALLNARRPGFELRYRMGNPGGGTIDEAASIWQRDALLWHVVDPRTMAHLAEFCSDLDGNLVDIRGLDGGARRRVTGSSAYNEGCGEGESGDARDVIAEENASKRKEVEELIAKLRRERPDRTMDQIMTHPEMALLMIEHLHAN
jgi:hypothetical protein